MIFETGQHLKCFLRISTVVEGIVQESTEQQLVLKSLDGESLLIIHQPAQDIVVTKVLLAVELSKPQAEQIADKIMQKKIKFEESSEQPPSEDDLRHMSIAELQIEKAKQERRIVAEKLRDHHAQGSRKVTYGLPGFLQKSSTK